MRYHGALPGNPLGLAPGTHVRLFDGYIEGRESIETMDAEEAMSFSDFPTYLSKFIRHTFLDRFTEVQGAWTQYTRDFSLEDFETYTSSRFGRFDDIPQKALGAEYDQLTLREFPGESIALKEFGAAIVVTRELIIGDRLNKIAELPRLAAEALARTMSKDAAINQFQANPTMYDGNALFSSAHANLGAATALTANDAGMALLQALELKLDSQVDDEGYKIQTPGAPYSIIAPIDYRWILNALVNNETILNAAGTVLVSNLVRGRYNVIEERFFTDANNYYMASDLKGPLGFLAAITLNGQTTPFIGLKDPGVRGVLGGNDPYTFDFDEVAWKLRHDFSFKPVEWRGIAASLPA
jgi:hypothetical protein